MTTIAIVCLVATLAILAFVGLIAVRNPVMFKTGLRNIPRRPAQTTLIVVGLMLSTLIITAAFGTGDTLTSSVTGEVYRQLAEADELIVWDTEKQAAPEDEQVIPVDFVDSLRARFAADPAIEAFIPALTESMPMFNTRTRLNDAGGSVSGFDLADLEPFGGLVDLEGNRVTLAGNQLALNEELADELDAAPGDVVLGFYRGEPVELEVVAVVPTDVFGGLPGNFQVKGGTVDVAFLRELTGKDDAFDLIFVSNTGGIRDGMALTDEVMERLEAALEDTPYQAVAVKQDGVEFAEILGNVFTTFFVVLGLFSIAAGVLLIFLIFVMLAAERKPEMGMARAVGAKRGQIVQSFLAEGMGYDLGSALLGLGAGMAVTFLMVAVVDYYGGEALGLDLVVAFSLRGLLVSFCLGIIATFIVIFVASWRASRLNIVAAIRDLPETRPINPEHATWYGLLRAVLNAFAAVGYFLFFFVLSIGFADNPAIASLASIGWVVALVGPFIYVLRGSNFAAPRAERLAGERIPLWPFFTVVFSIHYALALLLVRITRDRKPRSMPAWLLIAGIIVMPLGLLLVALQARRAPIAWSVGLGTMAAVVSILLVRIGLDADAAFPFLLGVSLIVFWVALLLRYFQIAERVAFTVCSLAILFVWYLPSDVTEPLLGPLEGDIEMFFLSGLVMITAGTFIVVYNADIILPVLARLASRFGRLVPAIKTGIAYPLTSRFRTGMTVAMIGLIIFALVMISVMNTNFANIFLNDDTKGGFDVRVLANPNNPIDDIEAAVAEAGLDSANVVGAGEVRSAYSFEVEISNPEEKGDPGDDGQPRPFLRGNLQGVDAGFVAAQAIPLKLRAAGYDTDEAVWEAFASNPDLAILPATFTAPADPFDPASGDLARLDPLDPGFEPFTLDVRNPGTGETRTLTVIGQAKDAPGVFWFGVIVSRDLVEETFPTATGQEFYLALAEGVDGKDFARELEAGLLTASVESLDEFLDEQQALQSGFLLVFQGFMGLGLIVGIAALGVVASRSVVERRQQIGMLRAIGYQRSMVALSFIFESVFVATAGIMLGLVLGLSLAWTLFTTGDIGEEARDATFIVPWIQVIVIAAIAFASSLLMTFLPARAASRVAVAEALRYE